MREGVRETEGEEREMERAMGSSVFFNIYGWIGAWGINKGFLILLDFQVYFAFQYAAVLAPAAGFQARRLLVCARHKSNIRII